jgi:hypothetical protein
MLKLRKKMSYLLTTAIAGVLYIGPAYSQIVDENGRPLKEPPISSMCPWSSKMRVLQASDFVCENGRYFDIVWDGWRGRLELYPDGRGRLLDTEGREHAVRHTVARNPQEDIDGLKGSGFTDTDLPSGNNHRLVFWVDFNLPPDFFTQRFDGYMSTADPGHPYKQHTIGGITWWNGLPFAFYSTRSVEYRESRNQLGLSLSWRSCQTLAFKEE